MLEELLKAIPVFLSSMVKFILGPLIGFGTGLHFVTTVLATIGGMMTSVVAFTYFGEWLREIVLKRLYRKRKRFTRRSRRLAGWRKYGLTVIALLTPVVLTPIGGTLLAVGSTKSKERIIFAMLISATGWAVIFSAVVYFLGSDKFPEFMKWIFTNSPPIVK